MQLHPAIFLQFSGEPEKDFVWFGTWIVRKEHINLKGIWEKLRYVPGLRKRRIVLLWNGAAGCKGLRNYKTSL